MATLINLFYKEKQVEKSENHTYIILPHKISDNFSFILRKVLLQKSKLWKKPVQIKRITVVSFRVIPIICQIWIIAFLLRLLDSFFDVSRTLLKKKILIKLPEKHYQENAK